MQEENWPTNGEIYYWVRSDIGQICRSVWNDGISNAVFRKNTGNCFKTRSEAVAAIARVKAWTEDRVMKSK